MSVEYVVTFPCFGGTCSVTVAGAGHLGPARDTAHSVAAVLRDWHFRFSRFLPDSELSRLNADPRTTVPVTPLLARLAQATRDAGERSHGLVDGTLLDAVERAGYTVSHSGEGIDLPAALAAAPERHAATADPAARWRDLEVDLEASTITRPPGLRLDSGGLAKGLFADVIATELRGYDRFVVNCCGDLRLGGALAGSREVEVESPFSGGGVVHTFAVADGAAATSAIGRRSWLDADGRPAHHLLDPGTGRPAFTGVVQATALAPTALEAERRAKCALLGGPLAGVRALRHGGLLVLDDGATRLVAPPRPRPTVKMARRGGRIELAGVGLTA